MSAAATSRGHLGDKTFLSVVALLGLVAVMGLGSLRVIAAGNVYQFLVRLTVTEVNTSDNTIRGYATLATTVAARDDLGGMVRDYSVSGATFHKWVSGKKKKILQRNVVIGDEVVMKGYKKSNGVFKSSWVVVNDTTFEIVGKSQKVVMESGSIDEGTITLQITSFTQGGKVRTGPVNKDYVFYVDGRTVAKSLGNRITLDQVPGNQQKVKVIGKRIDGWKYEVTKLFDSVGN